MTTVVLNTTTRKVEVFSSARDVQARAYGHDSKSDLEAATVPAGIPLLFLRGYAQAGDGGGALYKRAVSEPGHAGKIQSADGAWWEIAESPVNVRMFGAKGDGAADDRTSINDAIAEAGAEGIVHLPDGEFLLDSNSAFNGVEISASIDLVGQSPGATTISVGDGAEARGVSVVGAAQWGLRNFSIDGNKANQTQNVHGVRLEDVSYGSVRNLRIENTAYYGIGNFVNNALLDRRRLSFSDIDIIAPGSDGIDSKAADDVSLRYKYVDINNLYAEDVLSGPAIDSRFQMIARGIQVDYTNATSTAAIPQIRTRGGGFYNIVSQVYGDGPGKAHTGRNLINHGAGGCITDTVFGKDFYTVLQLDDVVVSGAPTTGHNLASNIYAADCAHGIRNEASGGPSRFSNIFAIGVDNGVRLVESGHVNGLTAVNCVNGLRIDAPSTAVDISCINCTTRGIWVTTGGAGSYIRPGIMSGNANDFVIDAPVFIDWGGQRPILATIGTTLGHGDVGKMVAVTTGNTNRTVTLPAVGLSGRPFYIAKVDSGSGTVAVSDGTSTIATLTTNGEAVEIIDDGSNWIVLGP